MWVSEMTVMEFHCHIVNLFIFSRNQEFLDPKIRVKISLKWESNGLSVFKTFQIIIWYQQNQNMQLFLMNAYFGNTDHCVVVRMLVFHSAALGSNLPMGRDLYLFFEQSQTFRAKIRPFPNTKFKNILPSCSA